MRRTGRKARTDTAGRARDLSPFPRPRGRGIFLHSQWCLEGGQLKLKYRSRTPRQYWRFLRNRLPHHIARHGEKGENRTNSAQSRTRHGSDAVCRYVKFASPEISYESFYYIKVSEHGGGSDSPQGRASCPGSVMPFFDPDHERRGIFLRQTLNQP